MKPLIATLVLLCLALVNAVPTYSQQTPFIPPNLELPSNSLFFMPNLGQLTDSKGNLCPEVLYYADRGPEHIFIRKNGYSIVNTKASSDTTLPDTVQRVDIDFELPVSSLQTSSADRSSNIQPLSPVKAVSNYYLGHTGNGVVQVPGYQLLYLEGLYPNVDLLYASNKNGLKLYFVVHPGGKADQILMLCSGQDKVIVNTQKEWVLETRKETIVHAPLDIYQVDKLNQISLKSGGYLQNNKQISCKITGQIDPNFPTVIEMDRGQAQNPQQGFVCDDLEWSSYYGGNLYDEFLDMSLNVKGEVFLTGFTASSTFPVKNGTQEVNFGEYEAVIVKFDANAVLKWATYYGGSYEERGNAIVCDLQGNVFIAGVTGSPDDLLLFDAGGLAYYDDDNTCTVGGPSCNDAFLCRFNQTDGVLTWCTYYGDTDNRNERFYDLAVDPSGNIYAVGGGDMPNQNPVGSEYYATTGSGFLLKFSPTLERLWATQFGATGGGDIVYGLTFDPQGNLFIAGSTLGGADFPITDPGNGAKIQPAVSGTGRDAFIAKFNTTLELTWATYYGGSDFDWCFGIDADKFGNVYIVGNTLSATDFPLKDPGGSTFYQGNFGGAGAANFGDVFFARFSNQGVQEWSSFYGGLNDEQGKTVKTDDQGNVYISGATYSDDFLVKKGQSTYYQPQLANASNTVSDAFVMAFNPAMEDIWASYFGGDGPDVANTIAVFEGSKLYLAGITRSSKTTYPLQDLGSNAWFQGDIGSPNAFANGAVARLCIESLTDVEDHMEQSSSLELFPNPSDGRFYCDIKAFLVNEATVIRVFNSMGAIVYQDNLVNYDKHYVVDLKQQPKGLYYLQVYTKGVTHSKKLILQ